MEIERVLNDHPAVAESAVIPVPAALSEDEIHAYVVLCATSTEKAERRENVTRRALLTSARRERGPYGDVAKLDDVRAQEAGSTS